MVILAYVVLGLVALGGIFLAVRIALVWLRHYIGRRQVEAEWRDTLVSPLADLGSTQRLEILPLIDDRAATPDLKRESGVSYLVKTDHLTLLFDTGLNTENLHPSPLLQNMEALGVKWEDIKTIVISHLHGDHVGGRRFAEANTFSLSGEQLDLSGVTAYTPVVMEHPTARCIHVQGPRVLAPGVASSGPISMHHAFMGRVIEQGLVVNVAGKGLVVITGCGHQGMAKLLSRVESISPETIYAMVGGLHMPITSPRRKGLSLRRLLPWWDRPSRKDLAQTIAEIKAREPKLIAPSPHDSCEFALASFREAFGQAYRILEVGSSITI